MRERGTFAMPTLAALPALVLALTMSACTQGQGPVVTETRSVPAFTRIEAAAGIQVSLTIGQAGPVVVHAQSNIQEKVTTGVREGTLRIEANDDFTVADPVVVDVQVPVLESVTLSGGASIEAMGLQASALSVSLSGGARATLAGTADSVMLQAAGGSVASLGDLDAGLISVTMDGGATAEVRASQAVQGRASGGAQLMVLGNGSVQVDTSGGATVSHT